MAKRASNQKPLPLGHVRRVPNTQRGAGENEAYYALHVYCPIRGCYVPTLLTADQLGAGMNRAEDQPEDVPPRSTADIAWGLTMAAAAAAGFGLCWLMGGGP